MGSQASPPRRPPLRAPGPPAPEAPEAPARPDRARVTEAVNAIRRIVRALRLAATASEKATGISGAQLFVLRELGDPAQASAPAPSMAELPARTATDPSSVSVVVRRLVERGLVARHVSADDARRAEVVITARGRAVLRRAPEPIQAKLIAGLGALPEADLDTLARGLEAVAQAMGEGAGAPPMFFEDPPARPRRGKKGNTDHEPT